METGTEKVTVKAAAVRTGDVVHVIDGRALTASVVLSVRVEQKPNVDVVNVHAWDIEDRRAHAMKIDARADAVVERFKAPDPIMTDSELEQLVDVARDTLDRDRASVNPILSPGRRANLERVVDRLAPPNPPSPDELLLALERLVRDGAVGPQLNQAERLLRRARVVGMSFASDGQVVGTIVVPKAAA
jgi:hypothetical protein